MINSSRVPFASNNPKTQNQHPKARIMVTPRIKSTLINYGEDDNNI